MAQIQVHHPPRPCKYMHLGLLAADGLAAHTYHKHAVSTAHFVKHVRISTLHILQVKPVCLRQLDVSIILVHTENTE